MGLFNKKKEDSVSEHIQNLEIKQATTPNNYPNSQSQQNQNQMPQQNFVNPFQNENNNNFNQDNQMPKTENYYQKQDLNSEFNFNNNQYPNSQSQQNQNMVNSNQTNMNNNLSQFNIEPLNNLGQNNSINKDEIQEMIDETIEKLMEEKWESLVDNVSKIASWKEKQESDVKQLKEDLLIIKDNFEKIEKKISNKLTDYDKNILDVNSEIKALEKVFQKITPTLVNNVNELSKIADNLRGIKPQINNNNNSNNDINNRGNNSKSLLE